LAHGKKGKKKCCPGNLGKEGKVREIKGREPRKAELKNNSRQGRTF